VLLFHLRIDERMAGLIHDVVAAGPFQLVVQHALESVVLGWIVAAGKHDGDVGREMLHRVIQ
jgi:hypothetical protein